MISAVAVQAWTSTKDHPQPNIEACKSESTDDYVTLCPEAETDSYRSCISTQEKAQVPRLSLESIHQAQACNLLHPPKLEPPQSENRSNGARHLPSIGARKPTMLPSSSKLFLEPRQTSLAYLNNYFLARPHEPIRILVEEAKAIHDFVTNGPDDFELLRMISSTYSDTRWWMISVDDLACFECVTAIKSASWQLARDAAMTKKECLHASTEAIEQGGWCMATVKKVANIVIHSQNRAPECQHIAPTSDKVL
jgi:hypothetical protein